MNALTQRQRQILDFLRDHPDKFPQPPTFAELCAALGMASRGSLHKHVSALIKAGLVEPFAGSKHGGIRLTAEAQRDEAAGKPIEALENIHYMAVPEVLKSDKPCYVLQVQGDSMIEAGIFDGDWVIIEQRSYADNGEIVVALVEKLEATLKYIDQTPDKVLLIPANASLAAMAYRPEQVEIQGVLVGQMRSYRSH